jgi:hypothetical protein
LLMNRVTHSNAMRTHEEGAMVACIDACCQPCVLIGLELLQAKDSFQLQDDRVYHFSSAMLQHERTQRSRVGHQPFANPRQMERMNRESSKVNILGSWTPSTSSMASVGYEIEGSRLDTLRQKGRLRSEMRNRILM